MIRIRRRLQEHWEHLSTAAKILIILDTLAVLLVTVFMFMLSNAIVQRMRAGVDIDLRRHVSMLRMALAWEGYYLGAEARTLARLEGMEAAIQAHDIQRLRRLTTPVQHTHGIDVVYAISPDGNVLFKSAPHGFDPSDLIELDLVRQGFSGKNFFRFAVAGGKVWIVSIAPHTTADGEIEAVFLLAREINRDYLASMRSTIGADVVLTDGQVIVSSLPLEASDRLLSIAPFADALRVDELWLQDVQIDGSSYRLLVTPLLPSEQPSLAVGLLHPTDLIEDAIRQTVLRTLGLGALLVGVPFLLMQFLVRGVFKPLRSLTQAAETIAAGDLDNPIQVDGTSEIRTLAAAFDQMRSQLRHHLEEQRRWNEMLDTQVRERTKELEQLCRIRDQLVLKLISAQEEERQRVARELHDETSQALANLVVTLGTLARLTSDAKMRQRIEQAKKLTINTLEDVKRIILDLRPRLLDDYGLMPAIRWYAEERLYQAGVDFTIEVQGAEARLPAHIETAIFRVIQEAVNNIARHARATQARIRLLREPNMLTVEIEDNGQGFDVQKALRETQGDRGLGLLGMKERITLAGGTMFINSAPGMGTHILIKVPIPQAVEQHVQDQSATG